MLYDALCETIMIMPVCPYCTYCSVPGKPLRVERLLANLGYGKRKECQQFVQKGRAVKKDGKKIKVGE
jgi:hypothetical protein